MNRETEAERYWREKDESLDVIRMQDLKSGLINRQLANEISRRADKVILRARRGKYDGNIFQRFWAWLAEEAS